MKNLIKNIKEALIKPNAPSTLLDEFNKRVIATPVESAIISVSIERGKLTSKWNTGSGSSRSEKLNRSVLRERGTILQTVAVKTCEPPSTFPNHAAWMLNIQLERALSAALIGERERYEILYDARRYQQGVKEFRTIINNH